MRLFRLHSTPCCQFARSVRGTVAESRALHGFVRHKIGSPADNGDNDQEARGAPHDFVRHRFGTRGHKCTTPKRGHDPRPRSSSASSAAASEEPVLMIEPTRLSWRQTRDRVQVSRDTRGPSTARRRDSACGRVKTQSEVTRRVERHRSAEATLRSYCSS